ncbi:hypothetical protein ZHAS_00006597 [Anopheles sinensis]|uniref:Uncharacterized protein n=1 Tax=Anopheles sinensis TaxID=74873 RepID=A0A084VMQ4_ANOSI|nr:hypothetical protein ZHAS_00006597 [Anopheles sinensis]
MHRESGLTNPRKTPTGLTGTSSRLERTDTNDSTNENRAANRTRDRMQAIAAAPFARGAGSFGRRSSSEPMQFSVAALLCSKN